MDQAAIRLLKSRLRLARAAGLDLQLGTGGRAPVPAHPISTHTAGPPDRAGVVQNL